MESKLRKFGNALKNNLNVIFLVFWVVVLILVLTKKDFTRESYVDIYFVTWLVGALGIAFIGKDKEKTDEEK